MNTYFTFFKNNQNIAQIKNQAKKSHKLGLFATRSEALSDITQRLYGLSYNKTVHLAKQCSPYLFKKDLYIPLLNKERKHHVVITQDKIALCEGNFIYLPPEIIHDFKLSNIERVDDNRWVIRPHSTNKNHSWIEITSNSTEISIEAYTDIYCDISDRHDLHTLGSTFILWSDLLE
jgi:hypothetical protein